MIELFLSINIYTYFLLVTYYLICNFYLSNITRYKYNVQNDMFE